MGDDVEDENNDASHEVLAKRKRLEDANTEAMRVDVSLLRGKLHPKTAVNNHNRFGILGELEIETDIAATSAAERIKLKNATNKTTKPTFCPPIFMYNVNIKHLVNQLEARSPKILFKIKNVNRNKSKLYISDLSVHAEMMAILKDKKVNSYSFTPKELRQTSLIIRGLYSGTEPNEIENALNGLVPNVISKASKFTTAASLNKKIDTGLFLISLLPGKGLSDVSHIRYLLSQSIVWEKPKKHDQEIQCRNCQKWGHIARNCNREFNCVKCNKRHEPGNCARKQQDESKPSCINCGKDGHPANWRGCTEYKNYIADKKARMKAAREKNQIAVNNVNKAVSTYRVTKEKSFASFFQTQDQVPSNSNTKPAIVDKFLELANYFMEPEELSLEHEIQKFLDKYRNMPKSAAKTEFLRILNLVRNSYGP